MYHKSIKHWLSNSNDSSSSISSTSKSTDRQRHRHTTLTHSHAHTCTKPNSAQVKSSLNWNRKKSSKFSVLFFFMIIFDVRFMSIQPFPIWVKHCVLQRFLSQMCMYVADNRKFLHQVPATILMMMITTNTTTIDWYFMLEFLVDGLETTVCLIWFDSGGAFNAFLKGA